MPETITLTPRLDYETVRSLIDELLAVSPEKKLHLDAKDVTYFGSLCAQTIIAASQRFSQAGGRIEIHNLTERANEQLAAMGLSSTALVEGKL